ncbi:rho GTPase-activating protein 12-like isoform X2 [Lineus longissimus]|uniref:rho GTPase-activating protein 12-like isoform X2 n=1 Tax=Lineus longissimus TaxID=88925 RepID=UPI00315CB637
MASSASQAKKSKAKVRVRALYSYSYEDDNGHPISMDEGEEFVLIKQTNDQWWNVKKIGSKSTIYVPANYVEVVCDLNCAVFEDAQDSLKVDDGRLQDSPKLQQSDMICVKTGSFPKKEQNRLSTFGAKTSKHPSSASGSSRGDPDSDPGLLTPDEDESDDVHDVSASGSQRRKLLMRTHSSSDASSTMPEYANLDEFRRCAGIPVHSPPGIQPGQTTHTDQSHEYMNLADIQAHIKVKTSPEPPPPPQPGKSLPVKTFSDGWEMHIDPSKNRPFYYNKVTSETSWKPPRFSPRKEDSEKVEANDVKGADTPTNGVVPQGVDANGKPLPPGWIVELGDNDEKQYINTSTEEHWLSSVDAAGKTYYYKQNSSDSMWELPEVEPVRHNSIDSAIRELEEVRSRVSGVKHAERQTRARSMMAFTTDLNKSLAKARTFPSKLPVSPVREGQETSFKKELQDLLQVPGPDGAVSLIVKPTPESLQISESIEMKPPTPGPIMKQPFSQEFPWTSDSPRENSPQCESPVVIRSPLRERDPSHGKSPLRETKSMMLPVDSLMMQHFPGMLEHGLGKESRESLMVQSMTGSAMNPSSPRDGQQTRKKEPKKPSDKKGVLNKTKIMEAGKKLAKKWSQTYIVLSGSNLLFYKDAKAAQKSPVGRPETVIDMSTAEIDWGNRETSSRKNVLQVTSDGAVYLLQTEDGPKIQEWNIALKQAQDFGSQLADMLPSPETSKPPSKAPPPVSKMKRSKSTKMITSAQRNQTGDLLRRTKSTKAMPNSSRLKTVEDSSHPRSKIRERLMNLLKGRPTRDSLAEKGIIKEQIFGSTISEICERENSTIPRFVMDCTAAIEVRGLSCDGIYRLSGNLAQVQKLRFAVDNPAEPYDLDDPMWDFHVLTGALKLFFRELKEPLFPFDFYDKLKFAITLPDKSKKLQTMKDLIRVLPKPNFDTTKLLFKHLDAVMSCSSQNRMQAQNIAIVFGPTLLWPKDEAPNMAVSTVFQNQIVEYILLEFKSIFS